jgi:Patatin-like phospholipase
MSRGARWILGLTALAFAGIYLAQRSNPLTLAQWLVVSAALLLLSGALLAQLRTPFVQYLFFCRFPLIFALLIFAFPILAATVASSLFGNLYALRWGGFILVATLGFLHSWVVLVTLLLIANLAPPRFEILPFQPPLWLGRLVSSRWNFVLALLLAAPTIAAAWLRSEDLSVGQKLSAALLGLAAAAGLILGVVWLRNRWAGRADPEAGAQPGSSNVLMEEDRAPGKMIPPSEPPRRGWLEKVPSFLCGLFSPSFWRGYIYTDAAGQPRFYRGHLLSTLLLLMSFLAYVVIYFLQIPGRERFPNFPPVAYVMFLLLALAWLLGGASFFLDRYRVPTLLILLGLSFFSYFVSDSDHHYRFAAPAQNVDAVLLPADAFAGWHARQKLQQPGQDPVLVAVTAVGGGITTGYWTDHVLYELQQSLGDSFAGSIGLVSGVSGGSVGALYFMDALADPRGQPLGDRLLKARDRAGEPSLPPAAWGLVYPDLWRTVPFGSLFRRVEDRAEALEIAWRQQLRQPYATLVSWRQGVREGRLPVPIFNSTITETGSRMLLTPIDLPLRLAAAGDCKDTPSHCLTTWKAHNFRQLYPGRDLNVATAARLSATFPWVSPLARPELERGDRRGFHLADGGYYDNYGVASLVDWLNDITGKMRQDKLKVRRILLVQIRAGDEREKGGAERSGWTLSVIGPIQTLLSIRTATQAVRNDTEVDLIQRLACQQAGIAVESFVFKLAPDPGDKGACKTPLSWQLTGGEKRCIESRWSTASNRNELQRLKAAFGRGADSACPGSITN